MRLRNGAQGPGRAAPQQLDWAGYDEFGGADGSFTPQRATPSPPRRLACTCSTTWACRSAGPTSSARSASRRSATWSVSPRRICCASTASVPRRSRSSVTASRPTTCSTSSRTTTTLPTRRTSRSCCRWSLAPTVRTTSCWAPPPRRHHADADEELLGAPIDDKKAPANGAINEDVASP